MEKSIIKFIRYSLPGIVSDYVKSDDTPQKKASRKRKARKSYG
jgi:hypothetical protein